MEKKINMIYLECLHHYLVLLSRRHSWPNVVNTSHDPFHKRRKLITFVEKQKYDDIPGVHPLFFGVFKSTPWLTKNCTISNLPRMDASQTHNIQLIEKHETQ